MLKSVTLCSEQNSLGVFIPCWTPHSLKSTANAPIKDWKEEVSINIKVDLDPEGTDLIYDRDSSN